MRVASTSVEADGGAAVVWDDRLQEPAWLEADVPVDYKEITVTIE